MSKPLIFREITQNEIDPTRITLMLIEADNGTLAGRITTLALNESGEPEIMAISDPPIEQALAVASQLAEFKEQDVDVFDPDHLWTSALGSLTRR